MSEPAPISAPRDIRNLFTAVTAADVLKILRQRLDSERITKHVQIADRFEDSVGKFAITPQNSLMLSFLGSQRKNGSKSENGSEKRGVAYRLIVLLDIRAEEEYTDDLRLALNNLRGRFSLDRVIIWTLKPLQSQKVRTLKTQSVETFFFSEREIGMLSALPFFVPLGNRGHDYDLAVNTIACLLMTRLKKLFHLVLSEIAAPDYDELYGKERIATNEVMDWEDGEVKRLAHQLAAAGRKGLAVDVGCGTGRHTFPLADEFDEVYAFDFSPKMIEQARKRKKMRGDEKILFDTIDIEYEDVPSERVKSAEGHGRVDLVVASFGMASFVEDTSLFLRTLNNWLKPGGHAILSFYNSDALIMNVTPNWRDTSLAAHLDSDNKTLKVELNPQTVFYLFCQPYSRDLIRSIKSVFKLVRIATFPSLMALMPNSLLADARAKEVFQRADRFLSVEAEVQHLIERLQEINSHDPDAQPLAARLRELLHFSTVSDAGYYVLVTVRKEGDETNAFPRITELLKESNCKHEILEHGPVQSINDVVRAIGPSPRRMVKTVLFRARPSKDRPSKLLVAVVLHAEKRVDKKMVADQLRLTPGSFVYASDMDVLRAGFQLGGLAPFGFISDASIKCFVDSDILSIREDWIYCGVGDNTKTLKIWADDFIKLVRKYSKVSIPWPEQPEGGTQTANAVPKKRPRGKRGANG